MVIPPAPVTYTLYLEGVGLSLINEREDRPEELLYLALQVCPRLKVQGFDARRVWADFCHLVVGAGRGKSLRARPGGIQVHFQVRVEGAGAGQGCVSEPISGFDWRQIFRQARPLAPSEQWEERGPHGVSAAGGPPNNRGDY